MTELGQNLDTGANFGRAMENRVEQLTWDVVGARISAGAPAILPIGAGAKEHGLHMPMATDRIQAEWLAERLAEATGALIWPTLSYGYYPAFVRYAGSVSLSEPTFRATVRELAQGLLAFGAAPVLVLDTGISTIPPVEAAVAGLSAVHHIRIHAGPRYRAAAARLAEQRSGTHADELETSRMLVIAPEVIDRARARPPSDPDRGMAPGPLVPDDPASPNYSPTGATGDPSLATADKGHELLDAMLSDIIETARAAIARNPAR